MASFNHSSAFSFDRFLHIIRRFWMINRNNWLVGMLGAAGLMFLFWFLFGGLNFFLPADSGSSMELRALSHLVEGPAMFLYVLGGLVLTSRIFFELHSPTTSYRFLTLPASTLEKFSAAWFVSSVAYTIAAMAAIFVLTICIDTVVAIRLARWDHFSPFHPFTGDHLETIGSYFFYQSIFLLGAVYFRKNNFLKTALVIIVFFIGTFFMLTITGFILALFVDGHFLFEMNLTEIFRSWSAAAKISFQLLFIAAMLLFGYLRLKNRQIV